MDMLKKLLKILSIKLSTLLTQEKSLCVPDNNSHKLHTVMRNTMQNTVHSIYLVQFADYVVSIRSRMYELVARRICLSIHFRHVVNAL